MIPSSCFHAYWIKPLLNICREIYPLGYYTWKSRTGKRVVTVTPMSRHPAPQMAFRRPTHLQLCLGAHSPNLSHDKSHVSYFLSNISLRPSPELFELTSSGEGLRNLCIHKQWFNKQTRESRLRNLIPSVKFYWLLSHRGSHHCLVKMATPFVTQTKGNARKALAGGETFFKTCRSAFR